jgi:aldehyde dehydrogenase (NAD+)
MDFLKALKNTSQQRWCIYWLKLDKIKGEKISSYSPVDGKLIGTVTGADRKAYDSAIIKAQQAFAEWRFMASSKTR